MITELTPQQWEDFPKYMNKWLQIAIRPIDRDSASKAIDALYQNMGLKAPCTLYFHSPWGCLLGGAALNSQLSGQISSQLYSQLNSQLNSQLSGQLYSQLNSQLSRQLSGQISSQLNSQLNSQLSGQLSDQLNSQLYSQLNSQLNRQYNNCYITVWWFAWCCLYDFGNYIGVKLDKNIFDLFIDFLSEVTFCIPYKNVIFVSDKPKCHWDGSRLHNPNGKAVEYPDGWGWYAWKGVPVPESIILHPETITAEEIIQEKNVELARIKLDRLTLPNFIAQAKAVVIDHDIDRQGYPRNLYSIDIPNDPDRFVRIVQVTCPTTQRKYMLRVHPDINTCAQAVAWTFGMTEKGYAPITES